MRWVMMRFFTYVTSQSCLLRATGTSGKGDTDHYHAHQQYNDSGSHRHDNVQVHPSRYPGKELLDGRNTSPDRRSDRACTTQCLLTFVVNTFSTQETHDNDGYNDDQQGWCYGNHQVEVGEYYPHRRVWMETPSPYVR